MPVVSQYFGEAGRNVDERIAIRVARFDQRDRSIGVFGEITRNDAAGRARADNDNIAGLLRHQRLSLSRQVVSSTPVAGGAPSRSMILRWIMLFESDLATPAREITFRHRVDRRSLLPLAARRAAAARKDASRMAREADVFILHRLLSRVQ